MSYSKFDPTYTEQQIIELSDVKILNALVASRIFGLEVRQHTKYPEIFFTNRECLDFRLPPENYCGDPTKNREVLNYLQQNFLEIKICFRNNSYSILCFDENDFYQLYADEPNLEILICKAALIHKLRQK